MLQRTFIVKFLCDELLNTAIIRQHLEQCAETSTELQQKLRSLFAEWKNLKSKEEILVARAAKLDPNIVSSLGAVGIKESSLSNHSKGQTPALSDRSNCCGISTDDLSTLGGGREAVEPIGLDRNSSATDSQSNCQNPLDTEDQLKDSHASVGESNTTGDKLLKSSEFPASNSSLNEVDASSLQPLEQHGHSVAQLVPPVAVNELQGHHVELNSVKNDITLLQESIASVESELLKVSVRREFLGSDSMGCLYWASGTPTGHSWIIVDRSAALQSGRKMNNFRGLVGKSSALRSSIQPVPFLREQNNVVSSYSPWVSYQADGEINQLVSCLKNNDAKERELKESILHWQKLRFQEFQKNRSRGMDEFAAFSVPTSGEKVAFSDGLVTRAGNLLEKRFGPCAQLETTDIQKKRGKKARLPNGDKMYRCECLELIWPCRHHCLSCHRTFSNDIELEGHNDGKCNSVPLSHEKRKEISDSSKVKDNLKSDTNHEDSTGELSGVEIPKTGFSELSAKLIKFQDDGLACPYDFEDICSKFVTQDSCKDLIQEIGLIGSKGVPSFISSVSPCLSDSTLALISPQNDVGVRGDGSEAAESHVSLGNASITVAGRDTLSDRSPKRSATKEINDVVKFQRLALGYLEQREGTRSSGSRSSVMGIARCCVVPRSSLRPLVGKVSQISRRLKINLLDMDAVLPEEALKPSKSHLGRRWAWRAFVKSATTIYEVRFFPFGVFLNSLGSSYALL